MTRFVLLHHELTRLAQSPRTVLFRCAFLTLIILFAAASVPWGAAAPRVQAAFASLFPVFFWCEMAFAVFIVPALVASDIPLEREKGTLELLLACPQSERDILLGKLGSQIAQVGVLLGAPFPLAFAAVALGGIRLDRALSVCIAIALTALLSAAIALSVSIVASRSAKASLRAVVLSGGLVLISTLAAFWMMNMGQLGFSTTVGIAAVALLMFAWAESSGGRPTWAAVVAYMAGAWMTFTFSSMAVGKIFGVAFWLVPEPESLVVLCPWVVYTEAALGVRAPSAGILIVTWSLHLFAALLIVRRMLSPEISAKLSSRTRAPAEDEGRPLSARPGGVKFSRKKPKPVEAPEPEAPVRKAHGVQRVLSRPGREMGFLWEPRLPIRGNPIYWRESLQMSEDENSHVRFWIAALAAMFAVPAISSSGGRNVLWGGTHEGIVIEMFLACLMVALYGAGTLSHELERGTLSLLVSTGYRSTWIVAGKMRATLVRSWPVLAVAFVHLSAIVLDIGLRGVALAWVFAVTVLSVAGLSLGASWWARRQRLALPLALALPFALWILPGFLRGIVPQMEDWFVGSDPLSVMRSIMDSSGDVGLTPGHAMTFIAVSGAAAIAPVALVCAGIERRMRA